MHRAAYQRVDAPVRKQGGGCMELEVDASLEVYAPGFRRTRRYVDQEEDELVCK